MENKELLSKDIVELLHYRINQEELSSRIYEQMSLWLNDKGFINVSKLYKKYSQEEMNHAQWSKDFLLDYGYTPKLRSLTSPDAEYNELIEILEATLTHELEITRQCNDFAFRALNEKNFVLYALGLKYCAEQQEEVSKAISNIDSYKLGACDLIFDQYVKENML